MRFEDIEEISLINSRNCRTAWGRRISLLILQYEYRRAKHLINLTKTFNNV